MHRIPPKIVVSFASRDSDPYPRHRETGEFLREPGDDPVGWGPTLTLLGNPESELRGQVSDWYYLCHPAPFEGSKRTRARTQAEAAKEMQAALLERLPPALRPKFHIIELETSLPPNDHDDLWRLAELHLANIRNRHPAAEIVLAAGHGAAPMQTVLILMAASGFAEPMRAVMVQRPSDVSPGNPLVIKHVALNIPSILKVARGSRPRIKAKESELRLDWHAATSPLLKSLYREAGKGGKERSFRLSSSGSEGPGKRNSRPLSGLLAPTRMFSTAGWPSVSCGTFTEPLFMRAELCGAVKGAYSGLEAERKGLFSVADGDLLFLDEIHLLAPENQKVLLTTLRSRRYRALGDDAVRSSNFRLLCATNLPLDKLQTALALDFYDRISNLILEVPPLRECKEDLPLFWATVCKRLAHDKKLPNLSHKVNLQICAVLQKDPLPGNWRDLEALAENLCMLREPEEEVLLSHVDEAYRRLLRRRAPNPSKSQPTHAPETKKA